MSKHNKGGVGKTTLAFNNRSKLCIFILFCMACHIYATTPKNSNLPISIHTPHIKEHSNYYFSSVNRWMVVALPKDSLICTDQIRLIRLDADVSEKDLHYMKKIVEDMKKGHSKIWSASPKREIYAMHDKDLQIVSLIAFCNNIVIEVKPRLLLPPFSELNNVKGLWLDIRQMVPACNNWEEVIWDQWE